MTRRFWRIFRQERMATRPADGYWISSGFSLFSTRPPRSDNWLADRIRISLQRRGFRAEASRCSCLLATRLIPYISFFFAFLYFSRSECLEFLTKFWSSAVEVDCCSTWKYIGITLSCFGYHFYLYFFWLSVLFLFFFF